MDVHEKNVFHACFCVVWRRVKEGFVFERDYHLRVVFVRVCFRQKHSSPLCVREIVRGVCFQQYPSHQPREYYCNLCLIARMCHVSVPGCWFNSYGAGWLAGLLLLTGISSFRVRAQCFNSPRHICSLYHHFPHCTKKFRFCSRLAAWAPRSFDRYSDLRHAHTVLSSSLAIGIFTYTMLLKGRLQDRHIPSASVLLHKHKSMPILNHLEPGSVKSWHQVTRTSVELLAWDDDRRRFSPAFERRREGSLRGQTESWAVKHL